MRKRLTAIFIALTIWVSLLPISAAAANTETEAETKAAVSKMLTDYAKKVYQNNADDEAFSDFFVHAFFGNGKMMVLSEKSPMTSALFNSRLLQEALTEEITTAILTAQELQVKEFYGNGSTSWHNYLYNYSATGYLKKAETKYTTPVGELFVPTVADGKTCHYTGAVNENDQVQTLLTGGLNTSFELKELQRRNGRVSYSVVILLSDIFDFDGTYDDVAKQGYDTSKDERLKDLGWLMTFMGIDEFDWSFRTTLQVETPINCDHQANNYHFRYSANDQKLECIKEDGFTQNEWKQMGTKNNGNYFRLQDTISLRHDRPWKIEYTFNKNTRLMLSETNSYQSGPTYLYHSDKTYAAATRYLYNDPNDPTYSMLDSSFVDISKLFKYTEAHDYRCCMENRISADGSNMVYITITDDTLGEVVVDGVPMNDHRIRRDLSIGLEDLHEKTDFLNGMDLMIRYIGTSSFLLTFDLDLKIWENGSEESSLFTSAYRTPTCTKDGGIVSTCADCGYETIDKREQAYGHTTSTYTVEQAPNCTEDAIECAECERCGETVRRTATGTALGHSFGEYVYDNNASCTADGTQTRKCTRCDVTETITAPDTAMGHDYKAVVTEPTYTEQGYTTYTCTVCGDSYKDDYTDVKQHSYVGVVTEPTCTAQGFTTYTCSECGDSYVDDYTDMIAHTPVIDPAVKPTCSEKGKTEGSHCGVCGYVIKKQALISTNDNHTMEESIVKMPTYDEPGQLAYICTGCGKTDYMEIPPLNKPLVNPFTDVMESDWFFEPVLWAVQEGVTGGKTETTFAPNEGCTRAQVVTFLWAANGKPEPTSENPFTDVANDAWYLKPVLWAVENGITTGVTATEFGPEQTCTRAQIATFLWAANGKPAVSGKSEFVDVGDTDWYSTPIIWAKENDVTGGIGNGKFGPNDTCTRAQVVTFLKKVYANK